MNRMRWLAVLLTVCFIVGGCSFSRSSKHSSRSSSSPCRSSSAEDTASTAAASRSYHEEVATLTTLYVDSGKSSSEFRHDLRTISSRYGQTDWRSNPETYRVIGAGLRRAGVDRKSIDSQSFLKGVDFAMHYPQMKAGYR